MGKKALNPADAHRRQLRKRELKKNKETRKKSQGLAVSKKEAQDIINELAKLDNLEKAAPLDRSMSLRREALEEKLAKVNEARKQQGMTALSVPSSSRPPTSTGDPSQWNNSAFNPYGMPGVPVQGEDDEEDDDDDDDSSDQSEDIEGAPEEVIDVKEAPIPAKLDDFSWIKVPDGEPPNEAQIYPNLELKEYKIERKVPEKRTQPAHQRLPPKPKSARGGKGGGGGGYPMAPPFMQPMYMPPQNIGAQFPPYGHMPPQQFYPGQPFMMPHQGPPMGMMPPMGFPPSGMPPQLAPSSTGPNMIEANLRNISSTPTDPAATLAAPTVISAEPKLRDLQKELTHLVPASLVKRRMAGNVSQTGKFVGKPTVTSQKPIRANAGKMKVDAAPDIEVDESAMQPIDEYTQFMEEVSNLE